MIRRAEPIPDIPSVPRVIPGSYFARPKVC